MMGEVCEGRSVQWPSCPPSERWTFLVSSSASPLSTRRFLAGGGCGGASSVKSMEAGALDRTAGQSQGKGRGKQSSGRHNSGHTKGERVRVASSTQSTQQHIKRGEEATESLLPLSSAHLSPTRPSLPCPPHSPPPFSIGPSGGPSRHETEPRTLATGLLTASFPVPGGDGRVVVGGCRVEWYPGSGSGSGGGVVGVVMWWCWVYL